MFSTFPNGCFFIASYFFSASLQSVQEQFPHPPQQPFDFRIFIMAAPTPTAMIITTRNVLIFYLSFPIFLNSLTIKKIQSTAAMPSAIGAENITPSIPINRGRIISIGNRNIICLVRERKTPFPAFPMDVNVFALIG